MSINGQKLHATLLDKKPSSENWKRFLLIRWWVYFNLDLLRNSRKRLTQAPNTRSSILTPHVGLIFIFWIDNPLSNTLKGILSRKNTCRFDPPRKDPRWWPYDLGRLNVDTKQGNYYAYSMSKMAWPILYSNNKLQNGSRLL